MEKSTKKIITIAVVSVLTFVFVAGLIVSAVFTYLWYRKDDIKDPVVLGYLTAGRCPSYEDMSKYPIGEYTHINFAFAEVVADTCEVRLRDKDLPIEEDPRTPDQNLRDLIKYIKDNNFETKVLVSVANGKNGWPTDACDTDEERAKIGQGCKALIEEYGLDGIDVDWEYPRTDHEIDCFNKTLKAIRDAIGNDVLFTIAGTSDTWTLGKYDNKMLSEILDFINIMTYDMNMENHSTVSLSKKVIFGYTLKGYKKSQLNLGIPFYGRSLSEAYEYWSYAGIKSIIDSGELTVVQKNNYSYAYSDKGRVSFDTPEQVAKKIEFLKKCGYRGAFCWHIICDYNNELFNEMKKMKE